MRIDWFAAVSWLPGPGVRMPLSRLSSSVVVIASLSVGLRLSCDGHVCCFVQPTLRSSVVSCNRLLVDSFCAQAKLRGAGVVLGRAGARDHRGALDVADHPR